MLDHKRQCGKQRLLITFINSGEKYVFSWSICWLFCYFQSFINETNEVFILDSSSLWKYKLSVITAIIFFFFLKYSWYSKLKPTYVVSRKLHNNNNDILLRTHGPYHRHKNTKVVSYTSAHITETVLAHDQHLEEHSSLSSPQLYRHLQKHRKWITIQ